MMHELSGHESSGWMDGPSHVFPVRVYYEDTDAAGIVYHARYLHFAERARTEMMRLVGHHHPELLARHDLMLVVRHCACDFAAPARLDDALHVVTRIIHVGGASVKLDQAIKSAGTVMVRIAVKLACINRQGRLMRLPDPLRETLANLTRWCAPAGPVTVATA